MDMSKKIIWEFDKDNGIIFVSDKSTEADKEKDFTFKLTRYKYFPSKKESMKIECKYKNEENGHIETSIQGLEKDLLKFMEYGVVFSRSIYADIRQKIENCYLLLEYNEMDDSNDEKIKLDELVKKQVLEMIGAYLSCDEPVNGLYHIPVEEFKSLLSESEFYKYDIKDIKAWLMSTNEPYIKCVEGRTDNLIRINKKPTRAISFYLKPMESIIKKYKSDNNDESDKEQKDEKVKIEK